MIPMNTYVDSLTMQRSRDETGRVLWQYAQCHSRQDMQCTCNMTFRRLRKTTVAVEKQ